MSMAHHAKEAEVNDPTTNKAAFAPVISAGCRCLIVGSLPGDLSLKKGEYYAHPRNIFWDLAAHFLAIDRDLPYATRVKQLMSRQIGLWDVLAMADRHLSADQHIRDPHPNDFVTILTTFPMIEKICLNGMTAHKYWHRLVAPRLVEDLADSRYQRIRLLPLPSTSPANAAVSRAVKYDLWSQAFCGLTCPVD
jgi:TDG/mug DNA glycosylase family protein